MKTTSIFPVHGPASLILMRKYTRSRQFFTASRRKLAQLGHKNLIFVGFKCTFMDFFLLKYELTQAQVTKLFY